MKTDTTKSSHSKKLRLGKNDLETQFRDSNDEDYPPDDIESETVVELFVNKGKDKESDAHSSRDDLFDNDDLDEG